MRRYFGGPQFPNAEFITGRESQAPPDFADNSGYLTGAKEDSIGRTAIGDPPTMFDVRSVYDARPVSAYDFNFAATQESSSAANLFLRFTVPSGFRAVVRRYSIQFYATPFAIGPDILFFPQAYDADVPNNQFMIGSGNDDIRTFFLVEENATFGARVGNPFGYDLEPILHVYGNLLPVTGVSLPYEIANHDKTILPKTG